MKEPGEEVGLELFAPWAEDCKAEKLAQCTDEERALAESYCEDKYVMVFDEFDIRTEKEPIMNVVD